MTDSKFIFYFILFKIHLLSVLLLFLLLLLLLLLPLLLLLLLLLLLWRVRLGDVGVQLKLIPSGLIPVVAPSEVLKSHVNMVSQTRIRNAKKFSNAFVSLRRPLNPKSDFLQTSIVSKENCFQRC